MSTVEVARFGSAGAGGRVRRGRFARGPGGTVPGDAIREPAARPRAAEYDDVPPAEGDEDGGRSLNLGIVVGAALSLPLWALLIWGCCSL